MAPTKWLPYLAVLLIGALIGFFIGNNVGKRATQKIEVNQPKNTTPIASSEMITATEDTTTAKNRASFACTGRTGHNFGSASDRINFVSLMLAI